MVATALEKVEVLVQKEPQTFRLNVVDPMWRNSNVVPKLSIATYGVAFEFPYSFWQHAGQILVQHVHS